MGFRIFQTIFLLFQRLPLRFHYAWARFFSWFIEKCIGYRRDVVMVNLARSFPQKKWKEIRKISKDFYRHFGEIVAEAVWFGGCRGRVQRLTDSRIFVLKNPELLQEYYRNSSNVMIVTSHFGNWELFGSIVNSLPEDSEIQTNDFVVVYKQLKSQFWNKFLADNRCAVLHEFEGYTESKQVLRYALAHKNERKIYVFPNDQFPYRGAARYEVPQFMNQKTQAMIGGVALASKLGMSVLYCGMNRVGRGKYEICFEPICEDASKMSVGSIVEQFYALLERDINTDPANYLWSHNRWK